MAKWSRTKVPITCDKGLILGRVRVSLWLLHVVVIHICSENQPNEFLKIFQNVNFWFGKSLVSEIFKILFKFVF